MERDQSQELIQQLLTEDAVRAAPGVMMDRMPVHDNSPTGEGSSRLPSFLASISARECAACLESFDEFAFIGSCTHAICGDCARQMFLGAIKDEQLHPPRCCGDAMPPEVGLSVLNHDEYHEFSQKAIEWTTKDRLYCADTTCSKFIPPSSIQDQLGSCPSCQQRTHVLCRSLEHPGIDCPKDGLLRLVLEMAIVEKWKRCFNCRHMVELDYGCNHITCRCGQEFCYICGQPWNTCHCETWDGNELLDMANRAVDEDEDEDEDGEDEEDDAVSAFDYLGDEDEEEDEDEEVPPSDCIWDEEEEEDEDEEVPPFDCIWDEEWDEEEEQQFFDPYDTLSSDVIFETERPAGYHGGQ